MPASKKSADEGVKTKMMTDIYSKEGKAVHKMELPAEVFAYKSNPHIMAQAVRVYLANQRGGTVATKTRAQVIGSTRKIYRQKGTGKARHGDLKAPIFIGGGVAHGPHPRDFSLSMSQQMKFTALRSALSDAHREGKIKVVEGLEQTELKTKQLMDALQTLAPTKKRKLLYNTLLIWGGKQGNILLAGRNIEHLLLQDVRLLTPYDIVMHAHILFTKSAIEALAKRFSQKTKDEMPKINTPKKEEQKKREINKPSTTNKTNSRKKVIKKPVKKKA